MIIYHFKLHMIAGIIRRSINNPGLTVTIAIIVVICGLAAIAFQDMAS